jgi:hypothetical protein
MLIKLANINRGITVGAGVSATNNTFLDINGDGLPDLLYYDIGGKLYASINDGQRFEGAREIGSIGLLDQEDRASLSAGVRASVDPTGTIGIGVTGQASFTNTRTGFTDMDGDGFADFIQPGDTYKRNNGGTGGFSDRKLDGLDANLAGWEMTEEEKASSEKLYYVQEPVRAWKASRSGTITVTQNASLIAREDGSYYERGKKLSLDTYLRGGEHNEKIRSVELAGPGGAAEGGGADSLEVKAGDMLYFHLNTGEGEKEKNGAVKWNVDIRYNELALFEGLDRAIRYETPAGELSTGEYDDIGPYPYFKNLYEKKYRTITNENGESYEEYYGLNPEWGTIIAGNLGLQGEMIERGMFAVDIIPADIYQKLFELNKSEKILYGYGYDPQSNQFKRINPDTVAGDARMSAIIGNQQAIDQAVQAAKPEMNGAKEKITLSAP